MSFLVNSRDAGAPPTTDWVPCDDGWRIALHRFVPRGRTRHFPVLLLHGIAANRLHFDLDTHYSLARVLRDAGYDVFIVELRGAGQSKPPDGPSRRHLSYGFADYAERDLPCAMAHILEVTQAPKIHGVGHSMGGMLIMATAALAPESLASVTTIGTPLVTTLAQTLGPKERRLLQVASRLSPAAKFTPPSQRRVPLRRLLGAAGMMMPLSSRLAHNLLLNVSNSEPYVLARLAREGIHDVPVQLVAEITSHMAQGARQIGPYSYEDLLAQIKAPTFCMAGSVDRIVPPQSVVDLVMRLTGPDIRFRLMGQKSGDRTDYGHIDLLLGIHAPDEVYPQVTAFLGEVEHAQVRSKA